MIVSFHSGIIDSNFLNFVSSYAVAFEQERHEQQVSLEVPPATSSSASSESGSISALFGSGMGCSFGFLGVSSAIVMFLSIRGVVV